MSQSNSTTDSDSGQGALLDGSEKPTAAVVLERKANGRAAKTTAPVLKAVHYEVTADSAVRLDRIFRTLLAGAIRCDPSLSPENIDEAA